VTRQAFIKLRLADTLPTAFIKLRLADTLPTRAVAVVGQGATMLEAVRTFVEQQAVDETTVAVLGRPTMAENVMEAFRMFFEQQAVDETTRKASDVPSPAPRAKVNRAPRAHSIVER
jgi:NADPH-dependent glutamate synthase beta subunit-like oxidoreductase